MTEDNKISSNCVIVKLNGGLGNQMFQWAIARMLETTTDLDAYLDMSYFKHGYARPYQLNVFNIEPKIVDDFVTKLKLALIWKLRKNVSSGKIFGYNLYSEKQFNFDNRINRITPNTYIEGFFQSELYFNCIETQLRNDFKYSIMPNEENSNMISRIMKNSPTISIHVRRGDYVKKEKNTETYAQCTLEYYKRAVDYIVKQLDGKEPTLYFFSDDIPWARRNLKFPYKSIYVTQNKGENSYEDMRLMSYCTHNIIANSSFSWWGAWLNDKPTKIVVAPEKWFNDDSIVQTDVVPKSWIRLEN